MISMDDVNPLRSGAERRDPGPPVCKRTRDPLGLLARTRNPDSLDEPVMAVASS